MEIVRIKFGENQVPSSEFPGILRQCHHDRVAHAPNLSLHLHTHSGPVWILTTIEMYDEFR